MPTSVGSEGQNNMAFFDRARAFKGLEQLCWWNNIDACGGVGRGVWDACVQNPTSAGARVCAVHVGC